MTILKKVFILFFVVQSTWCYTQELPPIEQFTPIEYNSGNQNWAISQSADKLIYVANDGGLLEYNGARWTLFPSPNETIMRSVTVIGDKVYTGCYMEFGYWEKDERGTLNYTSLSQQLGVQLIEDEEFWKIFGIEEWVIFQSLNRIYIYNTTTDRVAYIDSEERISKMFQVGEQIYFQRMGLGVYQIENSKASLFIDDEEFRDTEIVNIFSAEQGLLLLTRNKGFYRYANGKLTRPNDAVNQAIETFSTYNAIELSNGNFALGTISNGLIYLNRDTGIIYEINQRNGLLNNTVLAVFEDVDHNIWSGLDNGINYLNINAPIRVYKDKKGTIGSVYATAMHGENLYLGTNQGLLYRPLNSQEEFKLIAGTEGQVWCLEVIKESLLCGHHNGTYLVEGDQVQLVSNVAGTWNLDTLEGKPDLAIQGNYDGLYVLEQSADGWSLKNKLDGFTNSSRYFEVLNQQIFVNHEYKGVFKLSVDEDFTQVMATSIDTLLKGANSSIQKYKGKVLYASKKGILEYKTDQQQFIKDTLLSSIYTEANYLSGRIELTDGGEKLWLFTKSGLVSVSASSLTHIPRVKTIPLNIAQRRDVVDYENVNNLRGDDSYIIGTSSGYILIKEEEFAISDFTVEISQINAGINSDHSATSDLLNRAEEGEFSSDQNYLQLFFHSPEYYQYLNCTYQFQLLGLYDDWSDWDQTSSVFFKNLPPGNYTFNVRAKVGEKLSSNMATYRFSIARPWYYSNLMLVLYLLSVVVFSIFMHHVYRRYYRKQQEKLIDESKKELELAKIQNEKELIKVKNEQLEKDYKSKSKELAASAMSIVKQNELLMQIKEQLHKHNDSTALKPVIKIIDHSLNDHGNWEMFKDAFDNADAQFFKKLKELHPSLSPSDLKLCAYLRLNLSSKDIAPLFNISPRSVEIKRYRLRKKLNLANTENLTEYIISL